MEIEFTTKVESGEEVELVRRVRPNGQKGVWLRVDRRGGQEILAEKRAADRGESLPLLSALFEQVLGL